MAIRKINTKYYYDKIHLSLLQRQEEGEDPYYTIIEPPYYDNYTQFPRFNLEKQEWSIEPKKEAGYYVNYDNLSVINVLQYFDNVDLTGYEFGVIENKGDKVLKFLDHSKIEYQVASEETLQFFKARKTAKLNEIYKKAQVVKIVNGITFYSPLMGDFYNTTAQVRRNKGRIEENKLMYIRVPAIDGNEYEANLPIYFYDKIDAKLDKISLENNRIKELYRMQIEKSTTVNEIISLQFIFPNIKEININDLADEFIADVNNREQDRDYLASLNKKFFILFG